MRVALSSFSLRAASLHVEDGIAEFVHERPQQRNPLSADLRLDYMQMLDVLEGDAALRVLILRGVDGSFCSGGDVQEMCERLDDAQASAPERTRRRIESANAWLQRLLALPAVVIAAVDGPAFGGGFSLALHADLILASPRARFCMSYARVGVMPDFGSHYLLPRIIGLAAARDLLLTARSIGAAEARRLGLVRAIHPEDELTSQARALAQRLCQGPPDVFAMTKQILQRSFNADYGTLGSMEAQAQAVAMVSHYHRNAVQRFRSRLPLAYDWDRDAGALGFDRHD